jgi:response regulator RpfG family c-di-GMP phosphodiesterase
MRKTILLVEDDEFFRSAVKDFLKKSYEVIEAENGNHAKQLLDAHTPDLIISDIKMPECSGIELLQWVIKFRSHIPMMLMTGFSEILETTKAHDLGAKDFIPKPFKSSELLEKVSRLLSGDAKSPAFAFDSGLDADFCSLPVEDFLTERDTEFGIFVKVSDNKYIKIAHKGGKIPEEKIKIFKEKGVHDLYVKHADFSRIVGFTINISKVVSNSDKVADQKKLRFMQYTGGLIVQQAFIQGTDKSAFNNAKDFLSSSVSVITESNDALTVLDQLSENSDTLYAHSLGVSMYSVMIAKKMGINSPQNLFKIAMAGLFHNIGFKEISNDILKKGRFKLSKEERMLIESHPIRGKEILESIKGIPTDVIQITYEHHEDLMGTGYPRRIDRKKIHPLTRIISTADNFCCLTLKNPDNENPVDGATAVKILLETKQSLLDATCLKALSELFPEAKKIGA